MKVSKLQSLLADPTKVLLIGTTSVQKIYPSDGGVTNLTVNAADETVEFDMFQDKLHYVIDAVDVNTVIINNSGKPVSSLQLP